MIFQSVVQRGNIQKYMNRQGGGKLGKKRKLSGQGLSKVIHVHAHIHVHVAWFNLGLHVPSLFCNPTYHTFTCNTLCW